MREEQRAIAEFVRAHDLEAEAAVRLLDLVSELGELSKELLKGSDYGKQPWTPTSGLKDELGDCVFSLLCLCNSLNLDAGEALESAMAKYRRRLEETGTPGNLLCK